MTVSPPEPSPAQGIWVTHPQGQFRILVPEGWIIWNISQPEGTIQMRLQRNGTNSVMAIWPRMGCLAGELTEAVEYLRQELQNFASYAGYRVVLAPEGLMLDGHAAAKALFTHFLAYGPAYAIIAAILGPEWSKIWTFTATIHDESELFLGPEINATLDSFDAFGAAPSTWFLHPSAHFGLLVPDGWTAEANVLLGNTRADVVLTNVVSERAFLVTSEAGGFRGTQDEARAILQEALNGLVPEPGFQVLEPVVGRDIDGHAGAQAVVTWQPSTYGVVQVITVVVGAEWATSWGLIGTMYTWDAATMRSCVDLTIESFDILDASFSQTLSAWLRANYELLLVLALIATAAAGATFGLLIFRNRRRSE